MISISKRHLSNIILATTLAVPVALALSSCGMGGGGGGNGSDGDQVEPAELNLVVTPPEIDSGDRMLLKITMSEIHKDGLLLKVQFPTAMHYVTGTSFLTVDGDEIDIDPAARVTTGVAEDQKSYVVYDLSHDTFGNERSAQMTLKLEGDSEVKEGATVAVDADFNDPGLRFDQKFNALAPQFDPQDRVKIKIRDSSGFITPTPTPTRTVTPTPSPSPTKKVKATATPEGE